MTPALLPWEETAVRKSRKKKEERITQGKDPVRRRRRLSMSTRDELISALVEGSVLPPFLKKQDTGGATTRLG